MVIFHCYVSSPEGSVSQSQSQYISIGFERSGQLTPTADAACSLIPGALLLHCHNSAASNSSLDWFEKIANSSSYSSTLHISHDAKPLALGKEHTLPVFRFISCGTCHGDHKSTHRLFLTEVVWDIQCPSKNLRYVSAVLALPKKSAYSNAP